MVPRCVLVERPTEYAELLVRHGTREQVRFFLERRGRTLEEVQQRHEDLWEMRRRVLAEVSSDWRRATVERGDLDRFLFEPDDIVVVLGQDGLVANAARYLDGQPVIGLNPDPDRYPGVLVPHPPAAAGDLLRDAAAGRATLEARTMARAQLDDGQTLTALNELFVGHRTHQSARYTISVGDESERQSSSGVIVSTGTGVTGWAASIARERHAHFEMPSATAPALAYFVREAWPGPATGCALTGGPLRGDTRFEIRSELPEGGVVFADGIEVDHLNLDWGQTARLGVSDRRLMLVR
jgi:hypothetical protein